MLIKEYRIPLPLTVEEYRIAQLYMIAKKSREESHGEGSGVEIIVNEPYTNGPGGAGQYTKKIYHVGNHLPGWIKSLLPKSALIVEEEAWNAYPYTKTRYTCPFMEKFLLEIETGYYADNGYQENVFNLSGADLNNRLVDVIDIVKDQVTGADYLHDEDPTVYVSKKTKRGPLDENWLAKYWEAVKGKTQPTADNKALMCAYKLCRVEFKVWGLQSKLERFIHDIALRKTMVKAHRQAWAWQDEWYGLTMDDIREIERQTQLALQRKMAGGEEEIDETDKDFDETSQTNERSSSENNLRMNTSTLDPIVDENKSLSEEEFYDCMADSDSVSMAIWSSMEALSERDDNLSNFNNQCFRNASFTSTFRGIGSGTGTGGDCKIQHLIIVFHGGSVLDMNTDPTTKRSDLTTFRGVLEFVMRQHYPSLVGHIAVKQVTCPDTCSDILNRVSNINPYSFESTYAEGPLVADTQIGIVPLLLASKKDFPKIVDECIFATNKIFDDFLHSDEGCGFHGQVTIIGDSIGSVIAYDALTRARGVKSVPTLDVHVTDFFIFGSPLALILQMRAYATEIFHPTKPNCVQIYNLFHPTDPVSCRLEPLLYNQMAKLSPVNVVRYVKHPRGNMEVLQLDHFIHLHPHVFMEDKIHPRRGSDGSTQSSASGATDMATLNLVSSLEWWGTKRIDYAVYCPDGVDNFPTSALPHLFHGSYWESCDVVAFILRQISKFQDDTISQNLTQMTLSKLEQPREKWIRKRTSVKLKNVAANHRANDVVVREGEPQKLNARFMYGPLDMITLTGEKVDIYVMKEPPSGEWTHLATEVTDKNGRITYALGAEASLGMGVYPIRMVVRGDHSYVDFLMAVVPPQTPAVVFSIDGSFAASMSVTGKDPKVRAGAVDICRYWQDLGYLLIYVTGRPDMQQHKVLSWLTQHNFPHGLVSFADGLSTDPLGHKKTYLLNLVESQQIQISYAYGSSKDIAVYASLGLEPRQIFAVGKVSKKLQTSATALTEGYVAHLMHLKTHGINKHVQGNSRMVISKRQFDFSNSMIRHP